MNFAEKLNFLFDLTKSEGKALAAVMHVTPPQISKMRGGLRGLPRSRETVRAIAVFFAERCDGEAERDALAKAMNVVPFGNAVGNEQLADMILSWFLDEKLRDTASKINVDAFLRKISTSADSRYSSRSGGTSAARSSGNNTVSYFGVNGKQAAYMAFIQYILERNKPFELCVLSDENNEWIDEDPSFASNYYDHLLRLTEQGCYFKRIVGPLDTMEQAFHSLNRWFPLYLTGKATSYYYKRMRDNINRITVFVAAETAALYSFSVGAVPDNSSVTFFTTDTKTVKSMSAMFNKYLALCDPAMKTFNADTSEMQMHARLLEYESYPATCIQKTPSLSFITLPWELAVSLRATKDTKSKDVFLVSFAKRYRAFTANLEQHDFFDFISLESLDDIMDGLVPIPAANILSNEVQFYTPFNYVQHLKSIEYLLKRKSHYHVIIEEKSTALEPIIYVKEESAVLITRADSPFIIFDVSERNLMNAFTENLRRGLPDNVCDDAFKKATIKSIHTLIEQIEERLSFK